MSGLIPFDFDGHQVRAVAGPDGKAQFVLADVCRVLGLTSPTRVAERLHPDDLSSAQVIDSMGRTQVATTITESGVVDVTLDSRKPDARRFRRWLTHDVVPQIMQTGLYATPATVEAMLDDPDVMIDLLTRLKAARAEKAALAERVAADAPKVLFADSVAATSTDILVRDLAKILAGNGVDVGGTRLFQWLRRDGFLIRAEGRDYNAPTQRAMEMGLFRVKKTAVTHSDGRVTTSRTPLVTGKGQVYFVNRYTTREVATA